MEIKVSSQGKDSLDIEVNNLTIVELLRVYLQKEGAKFAAWKREHPTKNPILHVEGDNAKKLVEKAIAAIQKDIEKFSSDYKKAK